MTAERPSAARVARRAIVLGTLVSRVYMDDGADDARSREAHARSRAWLGELGVQDELEPAERALLDAPLGSLTARQRIDGTWLSEAIVILGWALGHVNLPAKDQLTHPLRLTATLKTLVDGAKDLLETAELRAASEIERHATELEAWYARLLEIVPEQDAERILHVREAWNAPVSAEEGAPTHEGKSLPWDELRRAPIGLRHRCLSIAHERRRALSWVLGERATFG